MNVWQQTRQAITNLVNYIYATHGKGSKLHHRVQVECPDCCAELAVDVVVTHVRHKY